MRQGLAQLLELHGYLVEDARTGEEALQQLTTEPNGFALILLDLMLPGAMGGRDLRTRQLGDPLLSAVPAIVVTGAELDTCEREYLRAEAVLEKPFRFDELLTLVKRYVVCEGSALQAD